MGRGPGLQTRGNFCVAMETELLTAKDVSKIFSCSLPLVYRMADRGQLPCVRWECLGEGEKRRETVRFLKDDIIKFIQEHRQ